MKVRHLWASSKTQAVVPGLIEHRFAHRMRESNNLKWKTVNKHTKITPPLHILEEKELATVNWFLSKNSYSDVKHTDVTDNSSYKLRHYHSTPNPVHRPANPSVTQKGPIAKTTSNHRRRRRWNQAEHDTQTSAIARKLSPNKIYIKPPFNLTIFSKNGNANTMVDPNGPSWALIDVTSSTTSPSGLTMRKIRLTTSDTNTVH